MLRKLPGFLTACILIVMPLVASAMGFGNIKLNSALNEPLDADIDLLSASVDDVSGLTVKLASRQAFSRAGVDRPVFLTSFKMEIKSRADDTYYIHLSSPQPVREPFLNFLLELSWYNGRILREYTVLLDPPGRVVKQPAVIATPEVTQPAQIARAPEPKPVPVPAVEPEPVPEPAPVVSEELPVKKEAVAPAEKTVEKTVSKPESIQAAAEVLPEPTNETKPRVVAAATAGAVASGEKSAFSDEGELFPRIPLTEYHDEQAVKAPESVAQGKLDYGITRKGDNLWTVAKKLQAGDESVSIYQIMMALLKNNPDAFRGGNINRLKIGHVLRIEDPALLRAMSDSEARAAYRLQTQEWDHYRQDLAAVANAPQAIVADDLGSAVDKGEADSGGELTVAAPSGKELTAGEGLADTALSGDVATLKEELDQLRADADAMGGTDAALNKQIKEMETELADMQRAISIQDTELAAVQQMVQKTDDNKNKEKTAATETTPETPAAAEEKTATDDETSVAEPQAEQASTSAAQEAAAEPSTSSEAKTAVAAVTPPAEAEKSAVQPPVPVVAPLPVPEQKTGLMATVAGVFATIAATLSGMLGPLAGNSLLLFVGLPILLVLIILMLIVIRRRKQAQSGFQESILSGDASPANADQAEAKEEESSFLSDFAVSGAGAIQAEDSEVDPLTEADVFMAYGRYEAAEERLTEAMEDDPSRKELKLKLLELYNATKNQAAFESTAENFYASLGENANTDPLWEKVLSMGKELAPDNPLFTGDVLAPAASDSAAAENVGGSLSDSQVMDIGLETGVFQAEELEPAKDEASGLDFNLDLDDLSEPEKTETAETDIVLNDELTAAEDSGLDFNLEPDSSSSDSGEVESSEPATTEMEMPEEEKTDTGLDFSLDIGLDADEEQSALAMDADGLDFEIDGDDETSIDLQIEEDSTGLDLSFDLDEADAVAQDNKQASSDLEFSLDPDEVLRGPDEGLAGDEIEQTMVINLDDSDVVSAEDEDEDTALDLNLDDAEAPASSTADALNDDVLAIDLGESLSQDSIDSDSEDTAADLSLDAEETSDAAMLDLAAGGDEVGTKLDLARAYIDMGDPEGARSILDEVLDEGNDEQKQEAQQLIQQIA